MQNILMHEKFACNHCQYYTRDMKLIHEHFSNKHRGLKASENSQECIIQMPFRAELWKYIQVNEFDNEMMREDDENDDERWNKMLEKYFEKSIEWINISETKENDNLRLMGVFIARIRWNLAVKNVNRIALIEGTTTPSAKDKLYKIILCGRRYIQ